MKRRFYIVLLVMTVLMLCLFGIIGLTGPLAVVAVPELLSYIRTRPTRKMLGNVLFPAKNISGLSWKAVIGANRLPVAAKIVAFNQEASIASREGVTTQTGRIPGIKRKISLDEETMKALYEPRNKTELEATIQEIYNDVENMIIAVETRIEMLKMEIISTGFIDINEDGIHQKVNFGFNPLTQTETLVGGALWSAAATCTPITDMQRWSRSITVRTGVKPARALTSETQFANLLQSAQVSTLIHGTVGAGMTVTEAQLQALLVSMGLPRIVTYDDQYRVQNEDGTYTQARYIPEDLFIMLPGEKLGDCLYSPTVEALRKVRDGVINEGDAQRIYAEIWEENEPPAHWTKAAALSFPTCPQIDNIFIADVA
jgi:hypothetical protein